ncbi:MAG: inositol monophosphatase family protein [Gammaproteobacteria bacterium]|nr:inositol monophosphatase family protein [Gammaproteobacteria bacterium]
MQDMLKSLVSLLKPASQEELMTRFRRVSHEFKADGSLVTEADLAMQQRMQTKLNQRWPEYTFLAEEMSVSQQQALLDDADKGMWCLDPLDGTSNYAMGIPYFAPSLAFIQGGEVQLGVVYDPLRDECFTAIRGQGAWLNDQALKLESNSFPEQPAIAIIDFKRLPARLAASIASDPPYKSQRSFGSVALDWCWMAAARSHIYLHGRQNIWDYAAGQLVFSEAGGYSSTLDGEDVFNHQLSARSAVAAVNKNLFENWYARLQQA